MIRLIVIAAIALAATAAQAQPNPQKLQACKQLAIERGFTFGAVHTKGAIKPRDFVRNCMKGTQR